MFLFKKVKWVGGIAIGICLVILILLNVIGYIFDCKYISVFAAVSEVNKYEVRSHLLMEAMDQVGVCSPEDAVAVWASGLQGRNAALQYSVMSQTLKEEYAKQLEENAPNWVTGMSSPWIEGHQIVTTETKNEDYRVIAVLFSTASSTGPGETHNAVLTVVREGDFWRITKLFLEEGLYPYTGFRPKQ